MSHRLKDNITSQYIEAANNLGSKSSKRRIVAYVESYDDIFFWRSILRQLEDKTRYFEVMLPSRLEHLERGKKAAIASIVEGKGGRSMIACVDADYDYLSQGGNPTSKMMLESPYVFHTYAYSIENLQCYAPSLHDVCVAATLNDRPGFDFEDYLKDYSAIIFPLFVWNIWACRHPHEYRFTMADFLNNIDPGMFSLGTKANRFAKLNYKVNQKISKLKREKPIPKEEWQKMVDERRKLGVKPSNTYLYIQGHHLFNKVIVPMMKKVCDGLIRQREREIAQQSIHKIQCQNELSCYSASLVDVALVLKKNVGFISSEPCQRILNDLRRFLDGKNDATEASGQR